MKAPHPSPPAERGYKVKNRRWGIIPTKSGIQN